MSETPNEAMAQRWNGESGQHWVANRERHEAGHQRLIPHLLRAAGITTGDRVLDIGCGCGETTLMAARLAAGQPAGAPGGDVQPQGAPDGRGTGSAHGLDLSGTMLATARRLAAASGLGNVSFEQGDAQVHPLPAAARDVAMSAFGVMFFGDPLAAFTNIAAAVRPGGRLAFLCWQDDSRNELFSIPLRAFMAIDPAVAPEPDLFTDPGRVEEMLTRAGWSAIGSDPVSEPAWLGSDAADVVEYMRGLRRFRMLTAEVNDPRQTEAALATMDREYAARQQPDGVWVSASAWLVRAQRSA
jgi:ubiquinone/menaquinone biosynthesis C-methylase UbiE